MKSIYDRLIKRACLAFCLILLTINAVAASSAPPDVILVFPFRIHSETDLSFLQAGISEILRTRLTHPSLMKVVLIEPGEKELPETGQLTEDAAVLLKARQMNADFVITGSVTILGESVDTSARCYNVIQDKLVSVFHRTGKKRGDVIAHVNGFADRLLETVFHFSDIDSEPAAKDSEARFDTGSDLWVSEDLPFEIKSMAAGDVDGDGRIEFVLIDDHLLHVYRRETSKLIKTATLEGRSYSSCIRVDLADLNNNRLAEIYLTCVNQRGLLNSQVIEWESSVLKPVVAGVGWYFNVIRLPERDTMLLGQKKALHRLFVPRIFQLNFQNKQILQKQRLDIPVEPNIFGFASGHITEKNTTIWITYDDNDHLTLFDQMGKKLWKSSDAYGGSTTYLESQPEGSTEETTRWYLPQRLHVMDTNGDGPDEIITVRNEAVAGRLFSRFRSYRSGGIECLGWEKVGLVRRWKTADINGYISDSCIADFNGDQQDDIAFSVVESTDLFSLRPHSRIMIKYLGRSATVKEND